MLFELNVSRVFPPVRIGIRGIVEVLADHIIYPHVFSLSVCREGDSILRIILSK